MNVASRRRLLRALRGRGRHAGLAGRQALVPAGDEQHRVHQARRANQTRNVIVPAVRGQILDDVGNRLVTNQTALVVSVDMMTLSQQPGGAAPVLHRLAPLLGMSYKLLTEKTRLCTKGVPQPCWAGSPYQPIPVDQNVVRPGGAAGAGGAEAVPRRHRAGPAGHRLPAAGRGQPGPGPRLPAADHPAGDRQPAPAGDRLLRRGPGRPGRPGGPVRHPAPRPGRAPRWCRSTPRATSPAPSARPRPSTATTS